MQLTQLQASALDACPLGLLPWVPSDALAVGCMLNPGRPSQGETEGSR